MDNQGNAAVELSAEESAYFESGGETELKASPPQDVQQSEPPVIEGQQEQQPLENRDEKGRFVPHQALHAEREEHKKTKAQLEEISRKQAIFEDRWNTLLKLREQQEQPQEETPPDPEQDIFGYAKWQAKQLEQLQTKISNQEKQTEQQRQIETQEREIWSTWQQDASSYASEAPDFGDAVKWLSDFRSKQLSAMSMVDDRFSTPEGITEQINAELRAIVVAAKQKGQRPAAVIHQMAKAYGFQAPAPDPKDITLPEQLARVANAQEQSKTIGQVQGRSGADAMTPEAIASMSASEFERWAADPKNAALLDKMLGA